MIDDVPDSCREACNVLICCNVIMGGINHEHVRDTAGWSEGLKQYADYT